MTDAKRSPAKDDVHLRIWLGGIAFDYKATVDAARNLFQDCGRQRYCVIELIRDAIEDRRRLPRLPCERLFQGPNAIRGGAAR